MEENLQLQILQVLPSVSLISQEVARKASVRQRISSRFRDFGGNEYAHGINGEPSLKSLIASRVKGTQLTRDFSRIVPLYFEIERRLRLNHEENIVLISALNHPSEHELRKTKGGRCTFLHIHP